MSWIPPYQTTVVLTETTDGEPVFEARHPELPRVLGQGDTPEEAVADLAEATAVVLEHFRDHNVPIPAARPLDAPIEMTRPVAAAKATATIAQVKYPARKTRHLTVFQIYSAEVVGALVHA